MHAAKYMVCCILFAGLFATLHAQHKVPAAVTNLFDDLPIDNPAKNSILRPGEDSLQKISSNIFIKGNISSTHCFLGEPILLTYSLYSALQSTSKIDKAPSYAGFSANFMQASNETVTRKKKDGKNYREFLLQQVQLTPLQEGVLHIDPMSVYNEVRYQDHQKEMRYSGITTGAAISISVEPLPVAGRPGDFSGAVGDFLLAVSADTNVAAGDNNILHIAVSGAGNFTAVSMPDINWPAGCDHFSVSSRLQVNKRAFPPAGVKTFDIPFVPLKAGSLIIPALRLSFFDARKKVYRQATAGPINVRVAPAAEKHGPDNVQKTPAEKSLPVYYWLLVVVILLVLSVLFVYRKKTKRADPVVDAAALPSPPAALPVAVPPDLGEGEMAALSALENPADYITQVKKTMRLLLQQVTGSGPDNETSLLQQLQSLSPAAAEAANRLYNQCNGLLYAPGNIDLAVRKELEQQLRMLAENIKRLQHKD